MKRNPCGNGDGNDSMGSEKHRIHPTRLCISLSEGGNMKPRFSALVNTWISPLLNLYGFKAMNDLFVYDKRELAWCIHLQQSKWNIADKNEFTLNVGIYVPGLISLYLGRQSDMRINFKNCCIHARIGMLSEDKLDKWWLIERAPVEPISDETKGKEIQEAIKTLGMPFLQRFENRDDMLAFLLGESFKNDQIQPQSSVIRFAYAAIMLSLKGEYDRCQTVIDKAIQLGEKSPIIEHIISLKKRLSQFED
ncbi:MAG: DUF4304 domain-containing protein [Sedimentisphaerales bacterium]|nr:DUF4304 domain-containing protein [Sedimentisphaerales bacterium]